MTKRVKEAIASIVTFVFFVVMLIGASGMDSECLILPIAIVLCGVIGIGGTYAFYWRNHS